MERQICAHRASSKKAFVFVDGQNLFHAAREAFGYRYPNYDVLKLAELICRKQKWQLECTTFIRVFLIQLIIPFGIISGQQNFQTWGAKAFKYFRGRYDIEINP